jgi:hypothetical protein
MLNAVVIIITTIIASCLQFYFDFTPLSLEYVIPDMHICGKSHALDGLIPVHTVHNVVIVGNLQVLGTNQFNPSSMLDDRKSKLGR